MALAMPSAPHPVLADFSTTTTSHGRMRQMHRRGEKAPEPIFLTPEGTCSDDPATVIDGEGTMLFTGGLHQGYKGYALSLWSEALAAAGGGTCNDADRDDEPAQSCTLWVIDPEAMGNGEHYRSQFQRFCRYVKTSRPRPGHEVRLPGDGAYAREREAIDHGLGVTDAVWTELEALADEHGLTLPETC
jgi:LDH2 family malate/lactate/ureidoglycolate dehydrogenase